MSPSVRRLWLAALTIVVAIIVLRSMLKDERASESVAAVGQAEGQDSRAADISTTRLRPPRSPARPTGQNHETAVRTSGVALLSTETIPPQLSLSGYVIDQFSRWSNFPEGYFAEGLAIRGGAITISGDPTSTAPRSGTLESPPLPLRLPSLAAPAEERAQLPEGAEVQLHISVTEDGLSWSPWYRIGRYSAPDGKRVSAGVQPTLANSDLKSLDSRTSITTGGPAIRYRLGLTASGVAAPAVSDVRIWKRDPQ